MGKLRFQISNFISHISNLRFEISDLRFQISGFPGGALGLEEEDERGEDDEGEHRRGGAVEEFVEHGEGRRQTSVTPDSLSKKWSLEGSRAMRTVSPILRWQVGATRAVKLLLPVLA